MREIALSDSQVNTLLIDRVIEFPGEFKENEFLTNSRLLTIWKNKKLYLCDVQEGGQFLLRLPKNNMEYIAAINACIDPDIPLVEITAEAGCGKCLGFGTPIIMYDGSIKRVEDIIIGDLLMGPDSAPRKVLSTTHGTDSLFKIKQNKGDDYIVNKDHILVLTLTPQGTKRRIDWDKEIEISVKDFISKTQSFQKEYKGFKTNIDFKEQNVSLDPYFLGLWLGDGTKSNTGITTEDKEIIDYLHFFAKEQNLFIKKQNKNTYHLSSGIKVSVKNNVLSQLRSLNLIDNKHIPKQYIQNSKEIRLKILAGLLDSDGTYDKEGGRFEFYSINKSLIEDVQFIARSLGFACHLQEKISNTSFKGTSFEYKNHKSYRLGIYGNIESIPCKVSRKIPREVLCKKNPLVTGIKIEEIGIGDYYGFTLSGDGRFLLGDFTVTHNTSLALASALHLYKGGKHEIIFVKENCLSTEFPLGFLKGDLEEKKLPVFQYLDSVINFVNSGSKSKFSPEDIRIETLGYLLGETFDNAIIIVDEAQNLTETNIDLLVTRVGKNSKMFILGDNDQIYNRKSRDLSGLDYLKKVMTGSKMFAHVNLYKCLRSGLAAEFLERKRKYREGNDDVVNSGK